MTAQPIASPAQAPGDEARMLRARLDNIAATLPTTMWLNPAWALFVSIPFTGIFPVLGAVPWPRTALVVVLQLINGVIAGVLLRRYRSNPDDASAWLTRFTVAQLLIGCGWGLMSWLLWIDGNVANHIMVAVNVIGILWAYSMSRTMLLRVYIASVLPTVVMASARFMTARGVDAGALEYTVLLTSVFTGLLAFSVKRQLENLFRARFANEKFATDLRSAHDEALRKRLEAEAANASKTTFLANMSHELRTPLNAILGFSDIIGNERLGAVGATRYREYANDIYTSGSHLLSIINDILDIAKIESGKMDIEPHAIDPEEALRHAVKFVQPRAREKKQGMALSIAPDTPWPFADDRALKQMVINLAANAVKFTPDGGQIEIRCYRAPDNGFELCVEDNGPGIAADQLERVFTPFNQIDNRYNRQGGGTGLGLSLVRGLAQLHKGSAWIESAPGKGVRAFVHLPVASEPAQMLKIQPQPAVV